jgi:manganese oxidase
MNRTRRNFLQRAAVLGAGMFATQATARAADEQRMEHGKTARKEEPQPPASEEGSGFLPVVTPDLPDLNYELDNGVKVFHLVAEPVKRAFLPGWKFDCWGYNGSVPGPTIQVVQGDRVRLIVDNHLPEPTTVHWHGFEIPIAMDGVPGVVQTPIPPGGRFVYEFTLHQEGTYFYHSHMAMQELMGMFGLFIMHPKTPYKPKVDKDFGLLLQEWSILPNNTVPNTLSMDFNWLTINGRSGPATTPLIVRLGDRVRIRFVNLSMTHHPMHLHGNTFNVTGTEGGRAPESTWRPENTVLVGVAQGRDVEFDAVYPGDWLLHCHLPHHMMNHMASMVGPMEQTPGMPAGLDMQDGMGMLQQGSATSKEFGPSFGRALGVGGDYEARTTNLPLEPPEGARKEQAAMQSEMRRNGSGLVAGFPQDMFMPMDAAVAKPETYGLRPTWSGGVQGMMTLVRVLRPELYDHIQELRAQQQGKPAQENEPMHMPMNMPGMKMPNH